MNEKKYKSVVRLTFFTRVIKSVENHPYIYKTNVETFLHFENQVTINMTNTEKNVKNSEQSSYRPLSPSPSVPVYNEVSTVPNTPHRDGTHNLNIPIKNSPQLHSVLNVDNLIIPPSPTPSLNINRPVFNVREFNENYIPNETQKTTKQKIKRLKPDFSKKAWIGRMKRFFPISLWLPSYDFRNNLIADIIVGITIASFQVPQSMHSLKFCIFCLKL